MKKLLQKLAFGLAVIPMMTLGVSVLVPAVANAADCTVTISGGKDCAKGTGVSGKGLFEQDGLFQTVTNVLLFLIGAVSVIMLIIGGFRYVVSNGDSSQVTAAKNTILYAVIGIIVALLAFAIVDFVVNSFTAQGGGGRGRD